MNQVPGFSIQERMHMPYSVMAVIDKRRGCVVHDLGIG